MRIAPLIVGSVALIAVVIGCGTEATAPDELGVVNDELKVRVNGPWVVYADPFLDGGVNPLANITGRLLVRTPRQEQTTTVSALLFGLPRNTAFVAHAHLLACADNKAGGHYQNSADAGANPQNELWLNINAQPFFDYEQSVAFTHSTVDWRFRPDSGHAVVVHSTVALPDGGTKAGAKLACVDVPF